MEKCCTDLHCFFFFRVHLGGRGEGGGGVWKGGVCVKCAGGCGGRLVV